MKSSGAKQEPVIEIGRVNRAIGLDGEIEILPANHRIQRFKHLKSITAVRDGHPVSQLAVDWIKIGRRSVRVKLEGIDSRKAAENLVNAAVCVPEKNAIHTGDWEFFHHELIGMRVVDIQGSQIGKITEIIATGANDVYAVTDQHGNESLIPAIRDVIKVVDGERRKVIIDPWDGMITKSDPLEANDEI